MIGLGRQAIAYNLPFFLAQPDVQMVALCDVDQYRLDLDDQHDIVLRGRKRTWPKGHLANCARYTEFREFLGRDDIDAVMITTPDHWHVEADPKSLRTTKIGPDALHFPLKHEKHDDRAEADRFGNFPYTDRRKKPGDTL